MYLYIKFVLLCVYFLYHSSFSVNNRWVVQGSCFGNCGNSKSSSDSKDDPAYTPSSGTDQTGPTSGGKTQAKTGSGTPPSSGNSGTDNKKQTDEEKKQADEVFKKWFPKHAK